MLLRSDSPAKKSAAARIGISHMFAEYANFCALVLASAPFSKNFRKYSRSSLRPKPSVPSMTSRRREDTRHKPSSDFPESIRERQWSAAGPFLKWKLIVFRPA